MADAFELPGGAGLGTAPMGGPGWQLDWGPSSPAESVAAVRAAVAAGVGWIDTAPFYGWGRAEEIIGAALEGMCGPPVLLTKCGARTPAEAEQIATFEPIPPDLAAAAEAATSAAFSAAP